MQTSCECYMLEHSTGNILSKETYYVEWPSTNIREREREMNVSTIKKPKPQKCLKLCCFVFFLWKKTSSQYMVTVKSAMLKLYWAGDNQGEWDEFCYQYNKDELGSVWWSTFSESKYLATLQQFIKQIKYVRNRK